jgi:NAD+ synthase (glutamine-hydrolysing)
MAADSFFNLYHHGFARIAVAVPTLQVADPAYNADRTIELLHEAARRRAVMCVFPELGLSAYTSDDLFQQQALLDACQVGLQRIVDASRGVNVIAAVGLPLRFDDLMFNCAVLLHDGKILGVVPKSYLPNYREFYELRWFAPGRYARFDRVELLGQRDVPFGADLLFRVAEQPMLTFHVEICEDLWVPIPPSSFACMAGATVLLNLSASNITTAKGDYRRQLVGNQSARCIAGYAYSAAGTGESTTDLAWDGHGLIYENGNALAETERFKDASQLIVADIDLDRLVQERARQTSFGQCAEMFREQAARFRTLTVDVPLPRDETLLLERTYERFPYVPANPATLDARCREIFDIQVQGLATRMRFTGSRKAVIGVSGGLDSTHALLVCVKAMELMGRPRSDILGVMLPGFATSERTQSQAERLVAGLGCEAMTIDITPSCLQMLKDIGHPYAEGKPVYDVTFENVQAGERTSHLFRLANLHRGIVIGTGDLSEFALGWCTYGVGDQMSHYGVNASVPKTLIQHLIRWVAQTAALGADVSGVLNDVLATTISPELVPGDKDKPSQSSEASVGPYELQDFHLYYTLRFGYRPSKVAFLAWSAWHDASSGYWPGIVEADRHAYDIATVKRWLGVFLKRFFHDSQFKRSAMPNAPKVGSGGSLSPRGDYRAPSDAHASAWLDELAVVPEKFSG